MSVLYFVMVSFVTGWTTPLAVSAMSGGGWSGRHVGMREGGVQRAVSVSSALPR